MEAVFGAGGAAAFILALLAIYRALRADSNRRFDAYTDGLEKQLQERDNRLDKVERRLTRYQHRVYQLEALLVAAGIQVPPWTATPDDIDELGSRIIEPTEGP